MTDQNQYRPFMTDQPKRKALRRHINKHYYYFAQTESPAKLYGNIA
jgi:hypothetical protein